MTSFSIDLFEVVIYKLEEGIFFAKLLCQGTDGETTEIDSRTSDALALAVRSGCKIFTFENILETAGLFMDQSVEKEEIISAATATESGNKPSQSEDLKGKTVDELNELLQQVLEQEDYVRAIHIRDELNKRKSK
jgi:bifunctional DNase/RNase